MNYIDIILIAIVVLSALLAMRKGLLRTLIELAGFFVTVPLSYMIAKKAAEPIFNSMVRDKLINTVIGQIDKAGDSSAYISSIQSSFGSLDSFAKNFGININDTINQMVGGVSNQSIAQATVDNLLKPVVVTICMAVIFVVLLILITIAIKIIAFVVGKIKLPKALSGANAVLGAALGAIKGVLIVLIIAAVLSVVQLGFSIKTTEPSKFEKAIDNSFVVEKVSEFNPLLS